MFSASTCCCCISLRTGTLIQLWYSLLHSIFFTYDSFLLNKSVDPSVLVGVIIAVAVSALGIYGINTNRRNYLLPYICWMFFLLVAALLFLIIVNIDPKLIINFEKLNSRDQKVFMLIVLFVIAIEAYLLVIVKSCYDKMQREYIEIV